MSSSLGPSNRNEFKDYCLRRLGHPVIAINVDDGQVEDRIDDALKYFWDVHFNGSEQLLIPHPLTQEEIDTRIINVDPKVIGISYVYNLSSGFTTNRSDVLFNPQYQMMLNQQGTIGSIQLSGYVTSMQALELMDNILSKRIIFRFNKHTDKLYIDTDMGSIYNAGDKLLIEATVALDQNLYNSIWKDKWFQEYATVLIKEQWGQNLSLYSGIEILGGITFDGKEILTSATERRLAMEESIKETWSGTVRIG